MAIVTKTIFTAGEVPSGSVYSPTTFAHLMADVPKIREAGTPDDPGWFCIYQLPNGATLRYFSIQDAAIIHTSVYLEGEEAAVDKAEQELKARLADRRSTERLDLARRYGEEHLDDLF